MGVGANSVNTMATSRRRSRGLLRAGSLAARRPALVLIGLALACAGCRAPLGGGQAGPATSHAHPVTVTYAYWALNTQETDLLRTLKARFEATHPGIQIELLGIPQRYYDKLKVLFTAGTPPDTFSANYGRLGDLVRAGAALDMLGLLGRHPDVRSRFAPEAWAMTEGLGKAVGEPGLWALPRDRAPAGLLLYNRALLASAGVAEPKKIWSWGDFRRACRAVARANLKDVKPVALNLYPYSVFTWLYQAGARIVSPDGSISVDSPEAAEAIDFLLGLWREGLSERPDPADDDSLAQFISGRVCFAFATFYTLGTCVRAEGLDWGIAPPLRGRVHACSCLPTFVALSSRTAHPEAAWAWARFLALEGATEYTRVNLAIPATREGLAPELFLPQPPLSRARNALLTALAISQAPPVHPQIPYERIIEETRSALQLALAEGIDGRHTGYRLASRLRDLAEKYDP